MSSLKATSPALAAALLFGASAPLAKLLVGEVPPLMLAGLLYLGSSMGLALAMFGRWVLMRTPDSTRQQPLPIAKRPIEVITDTTNCQERWRIYDERRLFRPLQNSERGH